MHRSIVSSLKLLLLGPFQGWLGLWDKRCIKEALFKQAGKLLFIQAGSFDVGSIEDAGSFHSMLKQREAIEK